MDLFLFPFAFSARGLKFLFIDQILYFDDRGQLKICVETVVWKIQLYLWLHSMHFAPCVILPSNSFLDPNLISTVDAIKHYRPFHLLPLIFHLFVNKVTFAAHLSNLYFLPLKSLLYHFSFALCYLVFHN